ncbi:MAG: phage tail protein I [Rhabdaerophilum sp.]
MTALRLLPPNRTRLEDAVAGAIDAVLPGPMPITAAFQANLTPVSFLPWLAAHRGVQLWFNDWSLARKRQIVGDQTLGWSIGTRSGARRHLAYVDATIVDAVAYPNAYCVEAMAVGSAPIEPSPFLVTYLVRVPIPMPDLAEVIGSTPVGAGFVAVENSEPVRRVCAAMRVARAPETEVEIEFQNHRPAEAGDSFTAGSNLTAGSYVQITRLGTQ